jgi:hypothetical protein
MSHISHICRIFAVILTLAALSSIDAACAQQAPAAATSPFAPLETPEFNPDSLTVPSTSSAGANDKVEFDKSGQRLPRRKLHPYVDIGDYDLRVKAGRNSLDTKREGLDSGELSNAESISGKRVPHGFLGLKLSTPIK